MLAVLNGNRQKAPLYFRVLSSLTVAIYACGIAAKRTLRLDLFLPQSEDGGLHYAHGMEVILVGEVLPLAPPEAGAAIG